MATSASRIDFDEGAAPATPAASKVRIYAKADGLLYSKDDAGAETALGAGGGGGLTVAYAGYNTIGVTAEQTTAFRIYHKKITLSAGQTIQSVGGYLQGRSNGATPEMAAMVLADSAGTPSVLLAGGGPNGLTLLDTANDASAGPAGWVDLSCTYYNSSGGNLDVWIGIQFSTSTFNVHRDGSGSDRYTTSTFTGPQSAGYFAITTTTDRYSIRALVIS